MRGLKLLEKHQVPYDLLFYVKHLKHATTVARACPNLKLVINHLAKPDIKSQTMEDWKEPFLAAAQCPNVWCKLSGMVTEADWEQWQTEDLKPYVDVALEAFGPERCMFGSDWPVSELAGSYQQVFDALMQCMGGLSENERAQILGTTATNFYGLRL